jgi:hypothetical protein
MCSLQFFRDTNGEFVANIRLLDPSMVALPGDESKGSATPAPTAAVAAAGDDVVEADWEKDLDGYRTFMCVTGRTARCLSLSLSLMLLSSSSSCV